MAKSLEDIYDELLQEYVDLPYSSLLSISTEALTVVMPYLDSITKDADGASLVIALICTAVAADGKLSELEYKLLKDLIGLDKSYDESKELFEKFCSDEWVDLVDSLVDRCPSEIKGQLIALCLAFVAVDETITSEENAFIAKLLS